MDDLERENKYLKEEIEKYKNKIKKLRKIIEKLKVNKDNWNFSLFNNNEIINNEQYINNYSFVNIGNDYSFNLSSEIENLTQKIYKGDNEANFEIFLTNSGSETWPEGRTKLICDKSDFKKENFNDVIILESQIPKQVKKYVIYFTNLKEYKSAEYISIFRFNIDGINIGEEILLTVIIDEDFNIPQLKGEDGNDLSPKSRCFMPYSDMNKGINK